MTHTRSAGDTPLSDLIAAHMASHSSKTWAEFLEGFRKSQVGVVAMGLPNGTTGEIVTTADLPMSVGLTKHAGGRLMALAFADPAAFAKRFGRTFNAALVGNALLATVVLNPECAGVLVNSALAEISIVIDRSTAESIVRKASQHQAAKPWWGFW